MRMSYGDLLTDFATKTGNLSNVADTSLLTFFKANLDQRYQLALAEIMNHVTQPPPKTFATVASQQYYHKPNDVVDIESATIDIGSLVVPLTVIHSQEVWDYYNQLEGFTGGYPLMLFPRRDDYGIWPIPSAVFTGNLNYHMRDRHLSIADYTTGTVAVTNNSRTITGTTTTWTAAMIGRWFQITDATAQDEGYWYRVSGQVSATELTLETSYEGATVTGKTYRVAQTPELPPEAHICLSDGAVADWFAAKEALDKATWYNNKFWTGDGGNREREDLSKITGGILGVKKRYSGRANTGLVYRGKKRITQGMKNWATVLSS